MVHHGKPTQFWHISIVICDSFQLFQNPEKSTIFFTPSTYLHKHNFPSKYNPHPCSLLTIGWALVLECWASKNWEIRTTKTVFVFRPVQDYHQDRGREGGRASDAPGQNHRDNFSVANLVTIIFSLSFFSLSLPVSFSRWKYLVEGGAVPKVEVVP